MTRWLLLFSQAKQRTSDLFNHHQLNIHTQRDINSMWNLPYIKAESSSSSPPALIRWQIPWLILPGMFYCDPIVRHTPLRTHSLLSSNRDVTYPRMLLFWPGQTRYLLSLATMLSPVFLSLPRPPPPGLLCTSEGGHAILLLNNHWRGNYIKLQTRLVTQLYLSSSRIIIILLVYCPDKTTEIVVTL